MSTKLPVHLVAALLAAAATAGAEAPEADVRSLDGQVQEIKSDVLDIAAELGNLEERLLYPSGTQVSVFITLESEDDFRLDAVKLTIDGQPATHHIYSFKELEALQKGGVQRIFTGNIPTGAHELSVTVIGKLESGKDFSATENFSFSKEVEPKSLGIVVAGPGLGSSGIRLGDW